MRKTLCVAILCLVVWSRAFSQTSSRVLISSITPSVSTGQDYTPWLNDNVSNLVTDVWASANMQYIDVKLKLQARSNIKSLSLYDYTGVFTGTPATIYAVTGTTRTLLATFTGPNYMTWDSISLAAPVMADTIIIHKYGNCIPEKIKIYGTAAGLSTPITGWMSACPGGTMSLGNASWGGTWASGNTAVATVNASTGVVTAVSPGTATITYTYTGLSTTAVVTVNPAAAAGLIGGSGSVCIGATTTLTRSGGSGTGTWSSSASGIASVSPAGVVTGVASGTATISYSVSGSCGTAVATKPITVGSSVSSVSLSGASTVCSGSTTILSASTSGGTWSSSASGVATVSSTGVVTGIAAGSATITYSISGSCGSASATKVITVGAAAATAAISGTATVCPGATTTLSASTTGGTWSSANTSVATVNTAGTVTGVSAGTATISYATSGSCGTVAATKAVTVNAMPSAGSISGSSSVTVGSSTTFSCSTSGGTWSCPSTSVATVNSSGSVTGVASGAATISYAVSNGCGSASATKAVTVTASTMTSGTTTGGTGTVGSTGGTPVYCKIPIDAKRWYQLDNTSSGLDGLFDGNTSAGVNTGWGKILTNFDAYYPVLPGETINIDSVRFYDGAGSNTTAPFTLYYIDSAWNRVQIASFIGTQYNMWVGPDPLNPTNYSLTVPAHGVRYLLINCSSAYPNEMELYGSYIPPASQAAAPVKTIALKQELGVNGFEWNFEDPSNPLTIDPARLSAAKSFTGLRHYLDWQKLEPNMGGYTYNPSHSGGWNLDTMYAACKANGIEVLADIKTQPSWMQATYPTGADAENVPVMYGADFSNPTSYLKQAQVGFQFAARYGANTSVSSSLLSVDASTRWTGDPANAIRKGMNVVKYIECDNERDKWWKGRNAYQTGREYAANLSAFYDGNKNTMGPGVGVKNADPSMQVVMGGVACPTTDYLRGMIDWCKEHRGYNSDGSVNLCWDVINYHFYPDNNGSMQGTGTSGAAPEVAHADTFAAAFINAAHTYARDMPVWITETGYDINSGSPLKAIPIGSKSALQTQADWILRIALLNARMGVERTFFYEMYDDDVTSATKFSSSGLINADKTRKPAADYLEQANRLMGNYVYKETISTNPMVDRYELAGQSVYVLVKPTQTGSTMSYTLSLGTAGSARVYNPAIGQDSMSVSTMTASGGNITLTVSETPTFVVPGISGSGAREDAESSTPVNISAESSVNVFPNPSTGYFKLSVENEKETNVNVNIYSEAGRLCRSLSFTKTAGKFIQGIDISSLPNGLYFMEVGQGNDKVTKKIIKVNQ